MASGLAILAQLPGMIGNHIILRPRLIFMVFGALFRLTGSISLGSKISVSRSMLYIKGMLNNPDIQPGVAVNRWIVGIKLFHFDLVHVPATSHHAPDGLSHCTPSPNDPVDDGNPDDWLDNTMGFAIVLMNSAPPWSNQLCLTSRLVYPSVSFLKHDSIYSAFHQVESTASPSNPMIPRSQEATLTDHQLQSVCTI